MDARVCSIWLRVYLFVFKKLKNDSNLNGKSRARAISPRTHDFLSALPATSSLISGLPQVVAQITDRYSAWLAIPSIRRGGIFGQVASPCRRIYNYERAPAPGLLEVAVQSGAQGGRIFAARQHFDYTSREHVADLAAWFRSNPLKPGQCTPALRRPRDGPLRHSRSQPACTRKKRAASRPWTRSSALSKPPIPSPPQSRRASGRRDDEWSPRSIEYALTALEHLGAFARPLGVRPLVGT